MPATAMPHVGAGDARDRDAPVGAGHARDPQYAATKQRQSIVLVFTGNHERSARDQNPVNVGFFSYLIACAAYLVLTTLLLVSWRGRALGSGEVKFFGQVLPTAKKVTYNIQIKRTINRSLVLAIADGTVSVDGREIYSAEGLRVGLFTSTDNF